MRLIDADKLKVIMRDSSVAVIVTDYTGEKTVCFGLTEKEILQIIDNVPTVEERPQGDCENCDFRKFTETFVGGVVEIMNKNGITSVEQLQEILKGGAE